MSVDLNLSSYMSLTSQSLRRLRLNDLIFKGTKLAEMIQKLDSYDWELKERCPNFLCEALFVAKHRLK